MLEKIGIQLPRLVFNSIHSSKLFTSTFIYFHSLSPQVPPASPHSTSSPSTIPFDTDPPNLAPLLVLGLRSPCLTASHARWASTVWVTAWHYDVIESLVMWDGHPTVLAYRTFSCVNFICFISPTIAHGKYTLEPQTATATQLYFWALSVWLLWYIDWQNNP